MNENQTQTETSRKLASVRRITEIRPIPDADAIECAMVGGWPVVVKKGEFRAGDLAIYLEIDSWVPHELAPFLSKGREPREYNGVKGERLRTVKLRGQVSQGLLLNIDETLETEWSHTFVNFEGARPLQEGDNLTELLSVQKWEAPVPAYLAGKVRGDFPSFIPKTDQERCLSGDSILETSMGKLSIKEVCEEKLPVFVKSFNIYTRIVEMKEVKGFSVMEETDQDWFCLTTKDGKSLIATGDHRVWCADLQSYRHLKDVQPGQLVVTI